jgi:hypothetical protein
VSRFQILTHKVYLWWLSKVKFGENYYVHDFTYITWGHNLTSMGGTKYASHSTPPVNEGDRIVTENGTFMAVGVTEAEGVWDMRFIKKFVRVENETPTPRPRLMMSR